MLVVVLAALFGPGVAGAQSAVCERECVCEAAPGSAEEAVCMARAGACLARQALCEGRLALYAQVMAFVGDGVETHPLSPRLAEGIQRLFPRSDLGRVRVGFAPSQPPENAITDCDTIYFARRDTVERVRAGTIAEDAEWIWLLHELRHTEQCQILGGREAYALAWMEDVPLDALKLGEIDPEAIHESMPMERDATDRAIAVLRELTGCCRTGDGQLR